MRIDSNYARREGKWIALKYILHIHEVGKAFYEAQENGYIPLDEPFIHTGILEQAEDGPGPSFTGLDMSALRYLLNFRKEFGALWEREWWRSTETHIETRMILAMLNGLYLSAHCAVRNFAIPGISALDISQELAGAELGWLASEYAKNKPVAIGEREFKELMRDLEAWHFCSSWGISK